MSNWKKLKEELASLKGSPKALPSDATGDGRKNKRDLSKRRSKQQSADDGKDREKTEKGGATAKTRRKSSLKIKDTSTALPEERPSKKPKLWFEGTVSTDDTHSTSHSQSDSCSDKSILVTGSNTSVTKCVALDCEMVRGGSTYNTQYSMLGRCSIVNSFGNTLYDKYVAPRGRVLDYCTKYSGLTRTNLKNGTPLHVVQTEVSQLLHKRILVGHALHNDLKVLFLSHPSKDIRDTSVYPPYRKDCANNHRPSLKNLAKNVLGITIQEGSHDSVEDARVAMKLYQISKNEWEKSLQMKEKSKTKKCTETDPN